jgi:hypothetical protein
MKNTKDLTFLMSDMRRERGESAMSHQPVRFRFSLGFWLEKFIDHALMFKFD